MCSNQLEICLKWNVRSAWWERSIMAQRRPTCTLFRVKQRNCLVSQRKWERHGVLTTHTPSTNTATGPTVSCPFGPQTKTSCTGSCPLHLKSVTGSTRSCPVEPMFYTGSRPVQPQSSELTSWNSPTLVLRGAAQLGRSLMLVLLGAVQYNQSSTGRRSYSKCCLCVKICRVFTDSWGGLDTGYYSVNCHVYMLLFIWY
jgi:hypothetical protein